MKPVCTTLTSVVRTIEKNAETVTGRCKYKIQLHVSINQHLSGLVNIQFTSIINADTAQNDTHMGRYNNSIKKFKTTHYATMQQRFEKSNEQSYRHRKIINKTTLLQLYFLQHSNINSFSHSYKHVLIHMCYSYPV